MPSTTSAPRSVLVALACVLVAAALLRLGALPQGIMFDDAASWAFASLPWDTFVQTLWRFEGNMVLYYLALRGWLVLGDSEIVIRSISVLCGFGTVAVVYHLGARLWNARSGVIAAGLLAIHAVHIDYSQQARGYALALFLVVLSTDLLLRARSTNSRTTWTLYVLTAALSCYAQVLSVLVIAAQWLWLLLNDGIRATLRRWLPALLLAVAAAPILLYVVSHDRGQIDWVPDFNKWRFIATTLQLAGGGYALVALLGACLFVGCVDAWRDRPEHRPGALLALAWLVVPAAVLVA
jgi:mannosyltransferase